MDIKSHNAVLDQIEEFDKSTRVIVKIPRDEEDRRGIVWRWIIAVVRF